MVRPIVWSAVGVVLLSLAVVAVVGLRSVRSERRHDCRNALKQIGVYVSVYESKFGTPPDMTQSDWLSCLWHRELAQDGNLFRCAVRGKAGAGTHFDVLSLPATWSGRTVTRVSKEAPPDLPLVVDVHSDADPRGFVLRFNGSVEELTPDAYRSCASLMRPSSWSAPAGIR